MTNRPAGFWQSTLTEGFTVLSALIVGFIYERYVLGLAGPLAVLLAFAAFLLLSTMSVVLNKGLVKRVGMAFLSSAAVVAFFYQSGITVLFSAALAFFFFAAWGALRARRALENSLKIRFFRVARLYMSKVTTGMVIAFIVLYVPHLAASGTPISEATFTAFFENSVKAVNAAAPYLFRAPVTFATSTFEEFVKGVVHLQLRSNPDYVLLSDAEREVQVTLAAEELLYRIREQAGVDVTPKETPSSALYSLLVNELAKRQAQLGIGFLLLWGTLAFFLVRGAAVVFYLTVLILAWFIFELLLAFGAVHIYNETRTQEVIEYSS